MNAERTGGSALKGDLDGALTRIWRAFDTALLRRQGRGAVETQVCERQREWQTDTGKVCWFKRRSQFTHTGNDPALILTLQS